MDLRPSSTIPAITGLLLLIPITPPALAAPALMDGSYEVRADGSDYGTWTFTPRCGAAADTCTARVEAHPAGWTAVATLSEGYWSLTRTSQTLFGCDDGSASPGELRARWDSDSLAGSLVLAPEGQRCGGSSAPLRAGLRLLKL
ncbi:MAG: hypothetical protein KDB47_08540 [Mycobacterium sp.]|nr:hypothetical protein [Mycobacterium sp.]